MRNSFDVAKWIDDVKRNYTASNEYKRYSATDAKFHGRLIPLCTPVPYEPSALVIGTNHSVFVDGGGVESEELAKSYAANNPKGRHTLVDDHHKFARNLRKLAARAGHDINRDWVCTNRCAIQTGEVGIGAFKSEGWHRAVQSSVDALLLQLIGHVQPKNLILCGNYASELIFGHGAQISKLTPKRTNITFKHQQTGLPSESFVNAIPIWHPSRLRYNPYANYIRAAWKT